jgi:threonylcarbamoyladenosine tRNA methylthiotransferase MtaB
MPSLAVRNFGCRVNQAEAFAWTEALLEQGVRLEADWSRSDIVLVNSCTLTGRTDRDVRKFIRKVSRGNPTARLVVTGCYAERAPAEVAALPGVVAVLPNAAKGRLPRRILEFVGGHEHRAGAVGPEASVPHPDGDGDAESLLRKRAFLKIQDGCDDRCAFCVIPGVRGRSVSVRPEEVRARVRDLAGRGFREIVLAGIQLSSYGRDLEPRSSLLGLLRELESIPGLGRLRLSSLDPRRLDAGLIENITADPKVCRHFHLSLQHASERVLRLMGRAGGPDGYARTLEELRRRAPDAALGADIIAGFPGETEDDFRELRSFLERSPLAYFHVFSFSPRPGTPAAERPRLPDGVVRDRAAALRRLSSEKNRRFRERFLGRELEAVVVHNTDRGAEALTANGIQVRVAACRVPEREFVRVRVSRVLPGRTDAEAIA